MEINRGAIVRGRDNGGNYDYVRQGFYGLSVHCGLMFAAGR